MHLLYAFGSGDYVCPSVSLSIYDRYPGFPGAQTQKTPTVRSGLSQFDAWQFPTLAWGGPTLPSALRRFTSEFGMGSGGTTALKPPGKFCFPRRPEGRAGLSVNRLKMLRLS